MQAGRGGLQQQSGEGVAGLQVPEPAQAAPRCTSETHIAALLQVRVCRVRHATERHTASCAWGRAQWLHLAGRWQTLREASAKECAQFGKGGFLGGIPGNTPTHGYLHANPKQASTAHGWGKRAAPSQQGGFGAASTKINCSEGKSTPELKCRHSGCKRAPNACAADARSCATRSCAEGDRNVCASLPDGTRIPCQAPCSLAQQARASRLACFSDARLGHGGGGVLYLPRSKAVGSAALGTWGTSRCPRHG